MTVTGAAETGDVSAPVQPLDSGAPIEPSTPPPPLPPSSSNIPPSVEVPVPVELPPVVQAQPLKPGVKTTEFWLTGIVLFVAHRIDQGAFLTLLLAALGGGSVYTVLRSYLKQAGINLPALPGDQSASS